jgi:hypothetical protein
VRCWLLSLSLLQLALLLPQLQQLLLSFLLMHVLPQLLRLLLLLLLLKPLY